MFLHLEVPKLSYKQLPILILILLVFIVTN